MFECTEIAESIYKGVVEHSYKKPTRSDTNRAGHSSKIRVEAASSTTYPEMIESSGKRRKRYVYHLKGRSKLTCLIHGPGNSSDECNILG